MFRRLSLLLGSSALGAALALSGPAHAQEPCAARGPVFFRHAKVTVLDHPYYSPVIPICARWVKRDKYGNEYLVPYYPGYIAWRHWRKGCPNWGNCGGPPGSGVPNPPPNYGVYTGARQDEESLLHLGGLGFSTAAPPAAPDFIEMLRASKGPGCVYPPSPAGGPPATR